MHVLVLGAGVAGLATAYFLARESHEVTVVERNSGVGLETSYANGGQLSYSYVAPLAGPGVLPKIPPWLLRHDSPLKFEPRWDLRQWRWCLAFLLACNQRTSDLTTRRMLELAFYSRALMRQLVVEERIDFNYVHNGKLVVHSERGAFDAAQRLMDYQASLGCDQTALSPEECLALEPALEDMRARISGGIYTASEDAGDCYLFCLGLERLLRASPVPVHFRLSTEVRRILSWKGRILGVETSAGVLEGDRYVLALGTQSPDLTRPLGLDLPVYPLKGYSLTLPVTDDEAAPRISVTDYKKKIVYARLGNELRVAGMADLAGYSPNVDPARLSTLIGQVRESFPRASDFSLTRPWCGLRPATPRGTPILGPTRCSRLLLNTGHGALGFTLAMACGRVTADFVAGRKPEIGMEGFLLP